MKPSARQAIGLIITCIFLIIYVPFAMVIGNGFLDKPLAIRIIYFVFAGLVWVIPLYPLYKWMRPKKFEISVMEKPPRISNLK